MLTAQGRSDQPGPDRRRRAGKLQLRGLLFAAALALAACQGPGATDSPRGSAPASVVPSESLSAAVPAGMIAFNRVADTGLESYFTIRTDGTEEVPLFEAEGCSCIGWSPTGDEIWTVSETDDETLAFTTMRPDGTDRTVVEPPIAGLSLGPGAATPDGQVIAFAGWGEDPSLTGVWIGSPDLSDVRQVIAAPEGVIATEPMAITPDGGRIVFWGEQGPVDYVTHAGALFAVNADGSDLEQLSPDGVHVAIVRGRPASMSPDGDRVAFAGFVGHPDDEQSAVYVVSIDGGTAERITEPSGGIWSAAWAPIGDRITYAHWWGEAWVSVVNADGSDQRDITNAASEEAGFGVWSPDGQFLLAPVGPEEARNLWIIDLEGNRIAEVTDELARYDIYSWAPA